MLPATESGIHSSQLVPAAPRANSQETEEATPYRLSRGRAYTILTDAVNRYRDDYFRKDMGGSLGIAILVGVIAAGLLGVLALFTPVPIAFIAFSIPIGGIAGIGYSIGFLLTQPNPQSKIRKVANELLAKGESKDLLDVIEMQGVVDKIEQREIKTALFNEFNKHKSGFIPPCFVCQLTKQPFEDPVVAANGKTYERKAIEEKLKQNPKFLASHRLVSNHALKEALTEYQNWSFKNENDDHCHYFACFFSGDTMEDPVIDPYGNSYEKRKIVQWIQQGYKNDPKVNGPLTEGQLVPNIALKEAIKGWQGRNYNLHIN